MPHKQSDTTVHALLGNNCYMFSSWCYRVSDNRYRNMTRSIVYMAPGAGMGWGLVVL